MKSQAHSVALKRTTWQWSNHIECVLCVPTSNTISRMSDWFKLSRNHSCYVVKLVKGVHIWGGGDNFVVIAYDDWMSMAADFHAWKNWFYTVAVSVLTIRERRGIYGANIPTRVLKSARPHRCLCDFTRRCHCCFEVYVSVSWVQPLDGYVAFRLS